MLEEHGDRLVTLSQLAEDRPGDLVREAIELAIGQLARGAPDGHSIPVVVYLSLEPGRHRLVDVFRAKLDEAAGRVTASLPDARLRMEVHVTRVYAPESPASE